MLFIMLSWKLWQRSSTNVSTWINGGTGYDNQRIFNVAGARENVGTPVVSFKKIYKPTNNNLRTSSNTSRANKDKSPRINGGTGYDNQRIVNVAGARENVGIPVVQQSGIQCYNCKEYGNVARECQKPKWEKDAAYHKKKMLLYEHNVIIDSLDMSYDSEQVNQDDDDDDLANERDLLASLIEKLKCEIDESKNRNKFLETSNKALVDKLK
nr:hypothetical protein [Tanacetum cinerariifolium]